MPISHVWKAIFVHIPRAGGSTVSRLLNIPMTPDGLWGVVDNCELSHLSTRQIQRRCPHHFREYFKFAFVRNPWDRLVSEYFYRVEQNNYFPYLSFVPTNFTEFVEGVCEADTADLNHVESSRLTSQQAMVHDYQTQLMVDFLGRYETYDRDLAAIMERLGVPAQPIPRVNSSRHGPYWEYYTEATASMVRQRYLRDVKTFGYTFERKT